MDVHLLAVACCSLEADALRFAVDENRTVNFSGIFSLRKDI
jgi:hypothetical protein